MNSEVFCRDEIWFVAKGNSQNSKLYSLVEVKNEKGESVRKDARFDKQYFLKYTFPKMSKAEGKISTTSETSSPVLLLFREIILYNFIETFSAFAIINL